MRFFGKPFKRDYKSKFYRKPKDPNAPKQINSKLRWDEMRINDLLVFRNTLGQRIRRRVIDFKDDLPVVLLNGNEVAIDKINFISFMS